MRLIGWVGLAFLAAGCLVSDVDPTGSKTNRRPKTEADVGGAEENDSDSVTGEPAPIEPDDAEDEGCRKLIWLNAPARPYDPASSLPEIPLELDVEYESGIAVVTLQGPQVLLDKVTECQFRGFGGFGYQIDWDDEPRQVRIPKDCSRDLRHEFHIGGTFDIRANTFHPGISDGAVFDSRHEARIVVDSAKLKSRELPLSVSIVGEARTFRLFDGPDLAYVIHRNQPVYLCVELRGETAVIDTSELIRIRNHVEGELSPDQYFAYDDAYKAALRAGQSKFHARAFVFDESRKLLDRAVTETFRMTQLERDDRHTVKFANDGLNVTMELQTYTPSCLQLDIDWGDGANHTQRRPEIISSSCPGKMALLRFGHSYAAPGTYGVVLRASEFEPWIPLEDVVGYSRYSVEVDGAP